MRNELAVLSLNEGRYEEALEASSSAVEFLPRDPVVRSNRLRAREHLGRELPCSKPRTLSLALQTGIRALNGCRCGPNAFFWGSASEEATRSAIGMTSLRPGDYTQWRHLYYALSKMGSSTSRRKVGAAAASLFKTEPAAWRDYASALSFVGEWTAALEAIHRSIFPGACG